MPARRRRGPSELGDDLVIKTTPFGNQQQPAFSFQSTNQHYNEKPTFEKIEEDLLKQRLLTTAAATTTITMTARDRTNEFANAIRSIQSRTVARAAVSRTPRHAKQIQSYSEFMMTAKNIGKNIASTYSKLEKLAMCKFSFLTYCFFIDIVIHTLFCNFLHFFFPYISYDIIHIMFFYFTFFLGFFILYIFLDFLFTAFYIKYSNIV